MHHWHFIALLAILTGYGECQVICPQGTVVLSKDKETLYVGTDTRVAPCPRGLSCSFYTWKNFDFRTKGESYIEYGTCDDSFNDRGCGFLMKNHLDGEVEDCTYTECKPGEPCSSSFTVNICNLGIVFYNETKDIVLDSSMAGPRACPPAYTCGFFEFDTMKYGKKAAAEMGICVPPEGPNVTCTTLVNRPNIDFVSSCQFTECNDGEDQCVEFSIRPNGGRGYRCDQGLFTYSLTRDELICADSASSYPCAPDDLCGHLNWINTDANGTQTYIEYGFCVDKDERYDTGCGNLTDFDFVNTVNSCDYELCSGDFCNEFTFLDSPDECPPRAAWNDVQILPGCTTLEALQRGVTCVIDFLKLWPFYDNEEEKCRMEYNEMFTCVRDLAADCVIYKNDGVTPCPSALDGQPNITEIFKAILDVAGAVSNTSDLINVLDEMYNIRDDRLEILEVVCDAVTNSSDVMSVINSLRRKLWDNPFWLGQPVCSDNKIVDDLVLWLLDLLKEVITVKSTDELCKAILEFKDKLIHAIEERCNGLKGLSRFLEQMVNRYSARLYEKALRAILDALKSFYPPCCPPPIIKCSETPIIRLDIKDLRKLNVISGDEVIVWPERVDYGKIPKECMKKVEATELPLVFKIDLTDCKPKIEEDDYYLNVSYTVRNKPYKDIRNVVQRFDDNCLTLQCHFERKQNVKMGKLLPFVKKTNLKVVKDESEFDLRLDFFEDDSYRRRLTKDDMEVIVPNDVYAKVDLVRLNKDEDDLIVEMKYCYATLSCEDDKPIYDLIVNGCPANDYVKVKRNFKPKFGTFEFESFVWTNVSDDEQKIYVRCKVVICHDSDKDPCPSKPDCTRSRRDDMSIDGDRAHSLITSDSLKIIISKQNSCDENNGGCSDACQMIGKAAVCKCYGSRRLADDGKTCFYTDRPTNQFRRINQKLVDTARGQSIIVFGLLALTTALVGYVMLSAFRKKATIVKA